MSTHYNPLIVRDGLVLCLDAANPRSYSGAGTIWNDLSPSKANATMFGAVPYQIDTVPCFDFSTTTGTSSSNASLGFTFSINMVPRVGNFTFSCWIKNPNATVNQTGLFSNAGSGDGFRFGVGRNGIYTLIGPTYNEGGTSFISTLDASLWYNVVAVFSRSTAQIILYLNGVYQNIRTIPSSQTQMQGSPPGLVRSPCCNIYTGKLSQFIVYNSAISQQQILSNFNTARRRFGV